MSDYIQVRGPGLSNGECPIGNDGQWVVYAMTPEVARLVADALRAQYPTDSGFKDDAGALFEQAAAIENERTTP